MASCSKLTLVQFKSLFIVYPHINMTYKGRTLRSLVQCPIELTGNEDYNIVKLSTDGDVTEYE